MDVEASAGRDSTRRRAAAAAADEDDDGGRAGAGAGGGLEAQVVPLELYDSARAKIDANLRWLFAKSPVGWFWPTGFMFDTPGLYGCFFNILSAV
uniref:Uncharacterized protein n=1 Tax=Salarias fasciatus TaxID=181472 RepID=A0A672HTD5_SALFA